MEKMNFDVDVARPDDFPYLLYIDERRDGEQASELEPRDETKSVVCESVASGKHQSAANRLRQTASPLFQILRHVELELGEWPRDKPFRMGAFDSRTWNHRKWPLRWTDGRRRCLETSWAHSDENLADRISDFAQEPVRLRARSVNANCSIVDYWRANRQRVIADAREWNDDVVSTRTLRRSLFHLGGGAVCSNFRASLVRRILLLAARTLETPPEQRGKRGNQGKRGKRGKWGNGRKRAHSQTRLLRVLDPCAGWGDRMLGAMSLMPDIVESYTGVDPNSALHPGYERLHESLHADSDVCMVDAPFQDLTSVTLSRTLRSRGPFDIVFTSPPYFDRELYSDDARQSFVSGMTLDQWLESFLWPMLWRAVRHLRDGGLLILSINDIWHVAPLRQADRDSSKDPEAAAAQTTKERRTTRVCYVRQMSEYLSRTCRLRYVGMIPFYTVNKVKAKNAEDDEEEEESVGGSGGDSGGCETNTKSNSTQPLWFWSK